VDSSTANCIIRPDNCVRAMPEALGYDVIWLRCYDIKYWCAGDEIKCRCGVAVTRRECNKL